MPARDTMSNGGQREIHGIVACIVIKGKQEIPKEQLMWSPDEIHARTRSSDDFKTMQPFNDQRRRSVADQRVIDASSSTLCLHSLRLYAIVFDCRQRRPKHPPSEDALHSLSCLRERSNGPQTAKEGCLLWLSSLRLKGKHLRIQKGD